MPRSVPSLFKSAGWLLLATLLVATAGAIGSAATFAHLSDWYMHLNKPVLTPPNWVFGPAWTTLYVLMIIAFWEILRTGPETPLRRAAIGIFLIQLVFNALWSVGFFGARSPLAGLILIAGLWLSILATIISFYRIKRLAGLILIPYLAWVSFATWLNLGVFLLNGHH